MFPTAFITLKPGLQPSHDVAREIFKFIRGRLAPYKRIRRIEFFELPKTVSGKIRRVELRKKEERAFADGRPSQGEFREEEFLELREPH